MEWLGPVWKLLDNSARWCAAITFAAVAVALLRWFTLLPISDDWFVAVVCAGLVCGSTACDRRREALLVLLGRSASCVATSNRRNGDRRSQPRQSVTRSHASVSLYPVQDQAAISRRRLQSNTIVDGRPRAAGDRKTGTLEWKRKGVFSRSRQDLGEKERATVPRTRTEERALGPIRSHLVTSTHALYFSREVAPYGCDEAIELLPMLRTNLSIGAKNASTPLVRFVANVVDEQPESANATLFRELP